MDATEALRTLEAELERGLAAFAAAETLDELERAHTQVLGRKPRWSEIQRSLGALPVDDRREVGRRGNEVETSLDAVPEARRDALHARDEEALVDADAVDVTLPGHRLRPGSVRPLTL